jgi:hypothetical protein
MVHTRSTEDHVLNILKPSAKDHVLHLVVKHLRPTTAVGDHRPVVGHWECPHEEAGQE